MKAQDGAEVGRTPGRWFRLQFISSSRCPLPEIPVLVIHSFVGHALHRACARQADLLQEGRKGLLL